MFSALRQGSLVYILDKSEPSLKIGQVVSVSSPLNQFGAYGMTQSTVDITVKVEDKNQEFKQVPSNLNVAPFGNVLIGESKDSIVQEVESMIKLSNQVLDSIEMHKHQVEACEEILKELNPQFAQQKDQEEKISNLEFKLGGIESKIDSIFNMLHNNDNNRSSTSRQPIEISK